MNMKTILAAALTAGFFVQPCMTALASVSAPESDKNQIGPGFEAPAEENAESAFTPWTKVDGVYVDDTGKAIDGAVLRGVSVSKWQGDVDWGRQPLMIFPLPWCGWRPSATRENIPWTNILTRTCGRPAPTASM